MMHGNGHPDRPGGVRARGGVDLAVARLLVGGSGGRGAGDPDIHEKRQQISC